MCWHETIKKARRQCIFSAYPSTGIEKVECPLAANDEWQCNRQPEAMVKPEQREIRSEARLGSSNPQICEKCQPQAATNSGSLDRCYNRKRLFKKSDGNIVEMRSIGMNSGTAEICTSTKVSPVTLEYDNSAAPVGCQLVEDLSELTNEGDVKVVVGAGEAKLLSVE